MNKEKQANIKFFESNIDFYSKGYKNFELTPWEEKLLLELNCGRVLDIGCGGGRITIPLLERGLEVTGVDIIEGFEAKIRDSYKGDRFKFVESDMVYLPFEDSSYDSITCINTITYLTSLEDIRNSIGEMSRVLIPGGVLYMTTWNSLNPKWGLSIMINFLSRRVSRFGETSPIFSTDKKSKRSRTYMYVPSKKILGDTLKEANFNCLIQTGTEFMGNKSYPSRFHPFLVIKGDKI